MKYNLRQIILIISLLTLASCSSFLNYKKDKGLFKNSEFDKKVTIIETEEVKPEDTSTAPTVDTQATSSASTSVAAQAAPVVVPPPHPAPLKNTKKAQVKNPVAPTAAKLPTGQVADTTVNKAKTDKTATNAKAPQKALTDVSVSTQEAPKAATDGKRQPDIENGEGFDNKRRPPADPFRVGEVVKHDVSYLGASAGTLTLKVNPFAVVNGRKSYNFNIDLKSNSFFTRIYAVDDQVQTFVDYENLVPHVFKLNIRDSGQVKEAQAYFDNDSLKADYWEHRYTEKHGHEEKKMSWTMLPYSQNAFSSIFYMRVFKFVEGKEYSFRVADDEKNVLFKAKVIERKKLKTPAGTFDSVKLKAEIYSRGNLAKASDFYMWVSDDDRKYLLRIEVKLPIGSLVSEAIEIQPGRP